MANLRLFSSKPKAQAADTVNEAGGRAYALSAEEALAQYVVTGCFNGTFYASESEQLERVVELAHGVSDEFIAALAVYARHKAYMKDSPALLLALLSTKNSALFRSTFDRVVDNGKMLRNFVQIMRSGVVGRRSLGSAPKKKILEWLAKRDGEQLLKDSIGNSPSLADVVKMVHPKPANAERDAIYAYLIGREYSDAQLPELVKQYEDFKRGDLAELPNVDFRLLTSLALNREQWCAIALRANWQMTRMNLNTFMRHGCFEDTKVVREVAARLAKPELVRRARVFPYQLMMAYMAATDVPNVIRKALQDALAVALENVPKLQGKTYVFVDASGSMQSPVTGYRRGATTGVRCIDAAALFAAALMKVNEDVTVMPFDTDVYKASLNRRDSVMNIARKLAAFGGGGTACGRPLAYLNQRGLKADAIIYFSDNESWLDRNYWGNATTLADEWVHFKLRNPNAKLVLTDVQPSASSQAKSDCDVLNVGGFSDQVFNVIADFVNGNHGKGIWRQRIEEFASSDG